MSKMKLFISFFLFLKNVILSQGQVFHSIIEDTIDLNLETDSATFQSTNYPSNYPDYEKRTWLIEAPPNHRISLIFTGFRVSKV